MEPMYNEKNREKVSHEPAGNSRRLNKKKSNW